MLPGKELAGGRAAVVDAASPRRGAAGARRRLRVHDCCPASETLPPAVKVPAAAAAPMTASPVLTPMRTARSEPALAPQVTAQHRALLAYLGCRANRAQRVVLVRRRHPEDRHDRIADVVLDRPAVTLDRITYAAKPPLHRPPQRLGIHPLPQRRRSHDVGEDHRDDFAPLTRDRRRRHRRAACRAEPGWLRRQLATARAHLHDPSLKPPQTPFEALRGSTDARQAPDAAPMSPSPRS